MAIWRDLVDDHGFTGRYNSVKRFVRKQRGVTTPEARVVIETAPGEGHAHSRHHQTPSRRHVRGGKPALLPLPIEPFRYYQYGERTVHLDGCVAYYGAPPGWIGRRVQVQWAIRTSACSIR